MRSVRTPAYRLHRPTGQAVVSFPIGDGKYQDQYLGKHDTQESRAAYDRLIAEWLAGGRAFKPAPGSALTVTELLDAYWADVEQTLWRFDALTGQRVKSSMQDRIRCALRPVRKLYGTSPAAEFGPLSLKAVRKEMIDRGLSRTRINQLVDCIKGAYAWAVTEELVGELVAGALDRVKPLERGRSTAPEPRKVKPAPMDRVAAVLGRVSFVVQALIRFQLLTGARPGEAVILRPGDVDRSEQDWVYRPAREKTDDLAESDGVIREVWIGPQAQVVLAPYLERPADAFCFSPRETELARQEAAGVEIPRTRAGDRYSVASYSRAIRKACDALWPAPKGLSKAELKAWRRAHRWHPHQLRHTAATEIQRQFGWDTARLVLGHRTLSATKIYAEENRRKAAEAIRQVG